jgi:hypothetical protein
MLLILENKSDYDDFYVIGIEDAKEQIANAKLFLKAVESFLDRVWNEVKNSGQ